MHLDNGVYADFLVPLPPSSHDAPSTAAVLLEGPEHRLSNRPSIVVASSEVRRRLLEGFGYRVVRIPVREWVDETVSLPKEDRAKILLNKLGLP